jgi:hypothetical protein
MILETVKTILAGDSQAYREIIRKSVALNFPGSKIVVSDMI